MNRDRVDWEKIMYKLKMVKVSNKSVGEHAGYTSTCSVWRIANGFSRPRKPAQRAAILLLAIRCIGGRAVRDCIGGIKQ